MGGLDVYMVNDAGSTWETLGPGDCRGTFQWKTLMETFAFKNPSGTLELIRSLWLSMVTRTRRGLVDEEAPRDVPSRLPRLRGNVGVPGCGE